MTRRRSTMCLRCLQMLGTALAVALAILAITAAAWAVGIR